MNKFSVTTVSIAALLNVSSAYAVNETGFAHPGYTVSEAIRTSYGECWTTQYRDPAMPIDPGCYGDEDKDGVADPFDKCPGTPLGAKVDDIGCLLDSDGDGVTDDQDQCPDTPAGAPVDSVGCTLDSDKDGVTDDKDKCPNTPAGAVVNSDGCTIKLILHNVEFETNKATLTGGSEAVLDKVADAVKSRTDIKEILVIGHTDSQGSDAYNQKLSESRAASVADYLVSKGIPSGMLKSSGKGESQPIADNGTAGGRAQNRRVEMQIE